MNQLLRRLLRRTPDPEPVIIHPPEEQLRRAARLIRERGWYRGDGLVDGRLDIRWAISHANPQGDIGPAKELAMQRAGTDNLRVWNDDPERTLDEVLGMLEGESVAVQDRRVATG